MIQREVFDELDAPVLRVTGADVPMPYNKHLEKAAKVDPAKVVAAVHAVLYLRLNDGNQGRHGGALAHDGRGAPRRMEEEEGDAVAVGDVLAEVETDKAVMELVARAGGTLLKQVVAGGRDGAGVGSWWRCIGEPGEAVENGRSRRRHAADRRTGGRPVASRHRQRRPRGGRRRPPAQRRTHRPLRPPPRPPTRGGRRQGVPARAPDRGRSAASTSAGVAGTGPRGPDRPARPRGSAGAPRGDREPRPAAAAPAAAAPPPRPVRVRRRRRRRSPTCRSPRSGRRSPSGWSSRSARSRRSTSRPKSTWSGRAEAREALKALRRGQGLVQRHHHQGGGARRCGSIRRATPGGRTTTSATGTRCTSAWRWRSRTG